MGSDFQVASVGLRDAADRAAAIALLRAVEPHAVDGSTAEEMAHGCYLLDMIEHGQVIGALAIDIDEDTATIRAAAASSNAFVPQLALIEDALRAKGVRYVGVDTRRPGLVRRLIASGYRIDRCTLEKEL